MNLWNVYLFNPAVLSVVGLLFCLAIALFAIMYRNNRR